MYLMRPTGNPQVIRHPQNLNLDPQGPVATGEPDPQVTFVDPHPCSVLLEMRDGGVYFPPTSLLARNIDGVTHCDTSNNTSPHPSLETQDRDNMTHRGASNGHQHNTPSLAQNARRRVLFFSFLPI